MTARAATFFPLLAGCVAVSGQAKPRHDDDDDSNSISERQTLRKACDE
jgi:hypothetical protein